MDSLLAIQIERVVEINFRHTKFAKFQKPGGWMICEAWFDTGEPRIQIRSLVESLDDAAIVTAGIQMAMDWLVDETATGGNLPR